MISSTNDADRSFDANLSAVGERVAAPSGMSNHLRVAGLAALGAPSRSRRGGFQGLFGRSALFSTIGLAAALVLAVGLFFPNRGGPTVRAAVVLQKLATQVQGDDVLEVMLDGVGVDEVTVNGQIQIAGKAIAGDIHALVRENPDEPPIEVDASLALSEAGGWVLLRKLSVPLEPEVAAIVAGLFPPGTETLLTFSADIAAEIIDEQTDLDVDSGFRELRSLAAGQLVDFLKGVIDSQADVGAVVTDQPDGTVLVTITVRDAESLRRLAEIARSAMGEAADGEIDIDEDDVQEILGCTLGIVYDPWAEAVRSFSISNVGGMSGTITISLRGGAIDPGLLDPARVTTPNTRTFDVGALAAIAKTFALSQGAKE